MRTLDMLAGSRVSSTCVGKVLRAASSLRRSMSERHDIVYPKGQAILKFSKNAEPPTSSVYKSKFVPFQSQIKKFRKSDRCMIFSTRKI